MMPKALKYLPLIFLKLFTIYDVFIAKFFIEEFQELALYKAVHKLLFKFRHDNTSLIWCHGLEMLRGMFYHETSVGLANFSSRFEECT